MADLTIDDIKGKLRVFFEQKVANIIKMGMTGTVLYATLDETQTEAVKVQTFKSALAITGVSETIKAQVKSVFKGGTQKVVLVTFKTDFESAVNTIKQIKFNYICSDIAAAQEDVATFAKESKGCVALVHGVAGDSIYVVNYKNPSVKPVGVASINGVLYTPRVAGALAGLPYSRSASSIVFDDLESVELPAPEDVDEGQFILDFDDDDIKVAAPINSLVTLTTNVTEDMKSIAFVEGMMRIESDIKAAFRYYKGLYKNHYNNQALFFAAVRGYYKRLIALEILDPNYAHTAGVDIEAQRNAWLEIGKDEAADWSDLEVKNNTFKKTVFSYLNIKILDAMEDLICRIGLF